MTLKIGMIGTNFISDDFCEAAAQVPGAELFAIYSADRKPETPLPQNTAFPACIQTTTNFWPPVWTQCMLHLPIPLTALRRLKR